MRRGPVAGLVVMGLALVGCGAATITESGSLSYPSAQVQAGEDAVAPPRPLVRDLRAAGGLPTDPVAVPDGETARVGTGTPGGAADAAPVAVVDPNAPRLGPAMPRPAGPSLPTSNQGST